MSGDTIKGIPRVDPRARPPAWKRGMQRLTATRPGAAIHRMIAAPLDAPIMKATGGRVSLAVGVLPVVVLTSTGARSGQRRETPVSSEGRCENFLYWYQAWASWVPGRCRRR
jgi:F420H(2)-dependent quinone reductase